MPVQLYSKAYHFTHQDNLPGIAEHGLLSHRRVKANGVCRTDISNQAVQTWRELPEPCFGRSIHDYVPFYINPLNPMLYCLRALRRDLVMLAIDMEAFEHDGVVFTDGNAASRATRFGPDVEATARAFEVLAAQRWSDHIDGKRRRCAELLVPDHVPQGRISGVYCSNPAAALRLAQTLGVDATTDASLFF